MLSSLDFLSSNPLAYTPEEQDENTTSTEVPVSYETDENGSVTFVRDPYEVTDDGHFKGHDGFVVPANFAEFQQEFPRHVRNFVHRRMMNRSVADCEDRESELNIYLMTLPEVSKFREPGTNGLDHGCTDRVQTFHPQRAFGASKARFLNFINYMLLNAFITLSKKASANPIERINNLVYFQGESDDTMVVNDEYVLHLAASKRYPIARLYETVLIEQFREFLEEHNPELGVVFDVLSEAETFLEAQETLGMNEQLFTRARNRLKTLVECFHTKKQVVPRQRKIYRPRAKRQDGLAVDIQYSSVYNLA